MGKNQGFLSVNLSKARDNSTWAVSWLAELTVTPSPISPVCPSQKPLCVDSKRPRVYRHHGVVPVHTGAFLNLHTGAFFERTHGDTTHTPHNTDRERQRETETERERERHRDKTRKEKRRQDKKREDETIKEKKREDEKGETRR